MLPARLILVRHGQSTYNAKACLQGQADPPLSDIGRGEAEQLRPALARFPDDRVVTSDLIRARETAALLGYPDARPDPRWREIDVGSWAGRPCPISRTGTSTPGAAVRCTRPTVRGGRTCRPASAAPSTSCSVPAGTWLVVCHGGVIRAALSHVTGADATRVAGPENASVTVIRDGRLEAYAWTPGMLGSQVPDTV